MKWITRCRSQYACLTKKDRLLVNVIVLSIVIALFYMMFHRIWGYHTPIKHPWLVRHGNRIDIPQGSPLRAQMEFKTVKLSTKPHLLSVPGLVEAIPSAQVSVLPPGTGRLLSLLVQVGDVVKAGQEIAVMRSPDFAEAYADYEKAISAIWFTQSALKRAQAVYQVGGNSRQVVERAQHEAWQAESELRRARASLKTITQHLSVDIKRDHAPNIDEIPFFQSAEASIQNRKQGLLKLTAPFSGRVVSINAGIGAYLNDVTQPIMSIINLDQVWVTAQISESLVSKVHAGQTVKISFPAYPDQRFAGKISFVDAILHPETRRNQSRIVLDNTQGLLQPNMFASLQISVQEPPQIMIPLTSVLMNDEAAVVYVESAPWVCQRREIELGSEDGQFVRVLSGLNPGERIVTCGGVLMNDQ